MNVKDYEYIVEIARQKSLSEAANRLCITQSALTKFLQRVEAQLGTPLFNRIGKRFVLTAIGQMYVNKGLEIMRLDQEMEDELAKMRSDGADAIRLGYSMGQTSFIMNHLLPAFYKRQSAMSVSLKEDSSTGLIRDVEDGKLDICLAYAREEKPGLAYFPLASSGMALAVPKHSPLMRKAVSRPDFPHPVLEDRSWMDEPYIRLASFTQSGRIAQEYFIQIGRYPKSRIYVENVRSAMSAVENRLGNCILAELPHAIHKVEYLSLPDLRITKQRTCLITRKGSQPQDAMKLLIHLAQTLYQQPEKS